MNICECRRCGQFFRQEKQPKLWITRRINNSELEKIILCKPCEEDLIEFMRKGVVNGTDD